MMDLKNLMADLSFLYLLGLGLVFVGIIVLIVAILLASILRNRNGKVKAGGVIVVGPVPIVFGSEEKIVKIVLKLAVALTAMLIFLTLIYYFLLR